MRTKLQLKFIAEQFSCGYIGILAVPLVKQVVDHFSVEPPGIPCRSYWSSPLKEFKTMQKSLAALLIVICMLGGSTATAEKIELNWNLVELGYLEQQGADGNVLNGLAVYVPGNRIASEDDFYSIFPDFCANRPNQLLEFAPQIGGAPNLSLLRLQVDFYGPKIGENETYIARSATIPLEDGECSL
jgi:hypothetical protein